MPYDFDSPLDRHSLSSRKWEAEFARLSDDSLLCLGTAEMDFKCPEPIVEALVNVAGQGYFGYPYKTSSYYQAVIGFLSRRFDWEINKNWIANHVGVYPSMQPLIEELTKPGDEILYQTPVHSVFKEVIESSNRCPIPNPLVLRSGRYEIDFDGLKAAISPKTRMLLFCSPHNPVGRVWEREELAQIDDIARSNGIIVVSDEVYCGLLFPGKKHIPIASLSKASSLNTITLISASKSFNTTGLKHSLVIAENTEHLAAYRKGLRRGNFYFGGSTFGEAATEAAFRDCDDWSAELMLYVQRNMDFLREFLTNNLSIMHTVGPDGCYFAWLDATRLGLTTSALKDFFERRARVVVTMGDQMGPGGEGHVRLNLACSRSVLEEALERISAACSELSVSRS